MEVGVAIFWGTLSLMVLGTFVRRGTGAWERPLLTAACASVALGGALCGHHAELRPLTALLLHVGGLAEALLAALCAWGATAQAEADWWLVALGVLLTVGATGLHLALLALAVGA